MYSYDDVLVKTEIEDALRAYLDSNEACKYLKAQHEAMCKTMETYMASKFTSDAEEMKKKVKDYSMEKLYERITELLQEKAGIDSGFTSRLLIYSKYRENSEKKVNLLQYLFIPAKNVALEFIEDFSKKYCKEMDKSDIDGCAMFMSYCMWMQTPLGKHDTNKISNAILFSSLLGNSDINQVMIMSILAGNN